SVAWNVDDLHIIVAPVILGGGKHLFEDFTKSLDLENRGVRQSRWATFIEFAVKREAVVSELEAFLVRHVEAGTVPGAVALRGGSDPEVVAVGVASVDGDPMRDDAIMRIQSMTKAITSVAALRLVEAGRIRLARSSVAGLRELACGQGVRRRAAALDDSVPPRRAITLRHLLTNTCGYGM